MKVIDFKDLVVLQKSKYLVEEIYSVLVDLPDDEAYSLKFQIKRTANSIPSNIAEGHKSGNKREYIHFLNISSEYCTELYSQLLMCVRIKYISKKKIKKSLDLLDEISKILKSIISKLNREK